MAPLHERALPYIFRTSVQQDYNLRVTQSTIPLWREAFPRSDLCIMASTDDNPAARQRRRLAGAAQNYFTGLPDDALQKVFGFTQPRELVALSQTNHGVLAAARSSATLMRRRAPFDTEDGADALVNRLHNLVLRKLEMYDMDYECDVFVCDLRAGCRRRGNNCGCARLT